MRKVALVAEAAALGAEEGGAPLRLVQRVELRLLAEPFLPLAACHGAGQAGGCWTGYATLALAPRVGPGGEVPCAAGTPGTHAAAS